MQTNKRITSLTLLLFCLLAACAGPAYVLAQATVVHYTVSVPQPQKHYLHVELSCTGFTGDSIRFKMPQWMPGYYQIMHYSKAVENFSSGKNSQYRQPNNYTWLVKNTQNKSLHISYDVKADKNFVANSYADSTHAYLVPAAVFLYINDQLHTPVVVSVKMNRGWDKIATGLETVAGKTTEFSAANFDILYDCPLLMGKLEALPSFTIKGIEHRFIGYQLGDFDKALFMRQLKKIVEASIAVIGDIPYKQYTFIGIGPGQGGIEHLNNTTVSFDGKGLNTPDGMNRTMNFLAHEYFHHYNVKRIRPLELGPFNYEKENRTNLLWVSEGLTVYYEYLAVKRAGLVGTETLLADFENSIHAYENDPGKTHQSLVQAGYETWSDGPFGKQGGTDDRSISYYDKGPIVALLLDFEIRHATQNKQSLDDVMRFLYWHYYKTAQRGFTDAEFQQACETIAGISLNALFEYVYTTREIDYNKYLNYAGLTLNIQANAGGKSTVSIVKTAAADALQQAIFNDWSKN